MKREACRTGSRLAPFLAVLLTVVGCSPRPGTEDLQDYVEDVMARQQPSIQPLPEIKPYRTFLYRANADGLRDPFESSLDGAGDIDEQAEGKDSGLHPDVDRPREVLEDFPLDSLRMLGTLRQQGSVWGVVLAPDGTVYRVQAGNHMGQNYGEVLSISEDRISVWEIIPNGSGGWQRREAALSLSE
jgi:type IV pilus assembly protein PilP